MVTFCWQYYKYRKRNYTIFTVTYLLYYTCKRTPLRCHDYLHLNSFMNSFRLTYALVCILYPVLLRVYHTTSISGNNVRNSC